MRKGIGTNHHVRRKKSLIALVPGRIKVSGTLAAAEDSVLLFPWGSDRFRFSGFVRVCGLRVGVRAVHALAHDRHHLVRIIKWSSRG